MGLGVKGALQLLMNRYGWIRFAQVPERVSTKSFVVLIIGNSKSNHLGAQGTFNLVSPFLCSQHLPALVRRRLYLRIGNDRLQRHGIVLRVAVVPVAHCDLHKGAQPYLG